MKGTNFITKNKTSVVEKKGSYIAGIDITLDNNSIFRINDAIAAARLEDINEGSAIDICLNVLASMLGESLFEPKNSLEWSNSLFDLKPKIVNKINLEDLDDYGDADTKFTKGFNKGSNKI